MNRDINGRPVIEMGQTLTCSVTGKQFTAARDGCSFNYAWSRDGAIVSDEGVDISEKRQLLDRTKPMVGYLSTDGKRFTGWKGNTLGRVTWSSESRTGFHGSRITHVRVTDVHGAGWYGKGSGFGMCIVLRARKGR